MKTVPTKPTDLFDLDYDQLSARLEVDGVGSFHAKSIWRSLYRTSAPDSHEGQCHPLKLRNWLNAHVSHDIFSDTLPIISDVMSTDRRTRKLLLRLDDGHEIETVVMGYPGRFTVCLSSQVGCAMGCVFCATGQMGFVRHLRPGEIVAQALAAQRLLHQNGETGLRNLVLMGMGEPLHNYDAVIRAFKILSDRRGLGVAQSRMTVCSVGLVPEIRRFAEENHPYNLAISLHAATDEERGALVPLNHRWPLEELLNACRTYSDLTGRKVFFGWTLIAGQNDTPKHAQQVAALLKGMKAQLNLIPLNPTDGFEGKTSNKNAAEDFSKIVQNAGIPCTIRQRRGIDVAAGCGQLKSAAARKQQNTSASRD